MTNEEIRKFIELKRDQVKDSLSARQQMEKTWRNGSDATWDNIAFNTRTKPVKKAERIEIANRQNRIIVKLRRELEMFDATLEKLNAL